MFAEMKSNELVFSEEKVLASELYEDRQVKYEEAVPCLHPSDYIHGMN